jgi:hypothetical protein
MDLNGRDFGATGVAMNVYSYGGFRWSCRRQENYRDLISPDPRIRLCLEFHGYSFLCGSAETRTLNGLITRTCFQDRLLIQPDHFLVGCFEALLEVL